MSTECYGSIGEATGLDYFRARYFSAAQGRFTSPDLPLADQDPADPQSWNLYAYGRNNPLLYTDPTGAYVCAANMSDDDCHKFEVERGKAVDAAMALREKYGERGNRGNRGESGRTRRFLFVRDPVR